MPIRFRKKIEDALQTRCGAGSQRLLQVHIVSLGYEAELLQELLKKVLPDGYSSLLRSGDIS